MSDLILELRQEHQNILSLIGQRDILSLLDLVETVHHPKEENLLFPLLAEHPRLREGGPRCMYFRGLQMDLNIHAPAEKLLSQYYKSGGSPPSEYKKFSWLTEQSPLHLPMYEHHLGHALGSAMREILSGKHPGAESLLMDLYGEYCRLLNLHIEKEDTCLFVLAETLLKRSS